MKSAHDIQVNYWSPTGHTGLVCSHTRYSTFAFPKHFHTYYTFILIEYGANQGFTDKQSYTIGPHSFLVINPGEVHAGQAYDNSILGFTSITIEPPYLSQLLLKNEMIADQLPVIDPSPFQDEQLEQQFSSLTTSIKQCNDDLKIESDIHLFLFSLFQGYQVSGSSLNLSTSDCAPYLHKARQFIESNFRESFSLTDLSASCHASPYHLLRQFKSFFGMTPFEYLNTLRIEESKRLMQKGGTLTRVALDAGFFDQSHFIRQFKKHTGVLPSYYRSKVC